MCTDCFLLRQIEVLEDQVAEAQGEAAQVAIEKESLQGKYEL